MLRPPSCSRKLRRESSDARVSWRSRRLRKPSTPPPLAAAAAAPPRGDDADAARASEPWRDGDSIVLVADSRRSRSALSCGTFGVSGPEVGGGLKEVLEEDGWRVGREER
eukprot:364831-Chlamydomonas_euryale.AAC.10